MSCFRSVVHLDTRNGGFIHVSGVVRYRAAIAKDTMGLESEQLCPAARMVQEIMSNKTAENDPYLYLDPHPRVSHFPVCYSSWFVTRGLNGCARVRVCLGVRADGIAR